MSDKIWKVLLCICIAAAWGALAACDDSRDSDDDNGGDSDSDSDGDSDADTGTGECSQVEWGSGCTVGNNVSNWAITGYMDGDLDGFVEEDEVDFTLEEIHCSGVQSLVFVAGDTA